MKKFIPILYLTISAFGGLAQDKWQQFNDYWHAGDAELTSYTLKQSRYGEMHEGNAVLIFVTEPFSASKQVKLDYPKQNGDDISVLKLNFTKKFLTGIYPYSMMMSSFVPVSYDKYPDALKVTTSSQEWCGHTFAQLNLDDDEYSIKAYSYFESEGDLTTEVENKWLEDELWQRIRIDPGSLPIGSIEILPSTFYMRLTHKPMKLATATASLSDGNTVDLEGHKTYTINYHNRELKIHFTEEFPHKILGWEETYGGKTTIARIKSSLKTPYWRKNGVKDRVIRKELGLSTTQ